ncbi:MAG: hypothetical protein L6R36_003627 [Xanthoria steineri]|nr:MAG: hypothetical protein L6R36_003627 [Xanthoria steineri]
MMATDHSTSLRHSPRPFQLSDASPTPLHNPDTSYLTSTPQLLTATPTSHTGSWEQLRSTPTRTALAPIDIFVPVETTPRSPRLRNDTPTPAVSTPGSWVEHRRHAQAVDRPLDIPTVEANPAAASESFYLNTTLDRRSVSMATTTTDSQESVGSKALSRQACQDGLQVDTVQAPASAKIASRPTQLDGVPEETEGVSQTPQRRSCYQKLCGSLRSIPSMLSLRQRSSVPNAKVADQGPADAQAARPARPARALAATQDPAKWWSTASLRFKKNAAGGRSSRQSNRSSLRGLFKDTSSANSTFGQSESRASPNLRRFDDNRHSRSFVGPTFADDTGSPVEDPFADESAHDSETEARKRAEERWRKVMARQDLSQGDGAEQAQDK